MSWGISQDSFEISVTFALPESVQHHLAEAQRLRDAATLANADAARKSRAAARELHDAGTKLRDIGAVLGVSHQRAYQLVNAK